MKDFSVIFEENSTILELNITPDSPVENWEVQGRLIPLRVSYIHVQIISTIK